MCICLSEHAQTFIKIYYKNSSLDTIAFDIYNKADGLLIHITRNIQTAGQ